eukprot:CAMPEP_0194445558 /NCGR_PEP_ID=MMETSP0176-20130528/127934_1 /TAXON_ID=216777 /ORGANISM="Proboscia alata, Strain PI-D3" /LENGTH=768 /DNA_ID=CAMNT_0039272141 /DNA_START=25 /DNA_END=2328 /DNA_ORIENTATION=+
MRSICAPACHVCHLNPNWFDDDVALQYWERPTTTTSTQGNGNANQTSRSGNSTKAQLLKTVIMTPYKRMDLQGIFHAIEYELYHPRIWAFMSNATSLASMTLSLPPQKAGAKPNTNTNSSTSTATSTNTETKNNKKEKTKDKKKEKTKETNDKNIPPNATDAQGLGMSFPSFTTTFHRFEGGTPTTTKKSAPLTPPSMRQVQPGTVVQLDNFLSVFECRTILNLLYNQENSQRTKEAATGSSTSNTPPQNANSSPLLTIHPPAHQDPKNASPNQQQQLLREHNGFGPPTSDAYAEPDPKGNNSGSTSTTSSSGNSGTPGQYLHTTRHSSQSYLWPLQCDDNFVTNTNAKNQETHRSKSDCTAAVMLSASMLGVDYNGNSFVDNWNYESLEKSFPDSLFLTKGLLPRIEMITGVPMSHYEMPILMERYAADPKPQFLETMIMDGTSEVGNGSGIGGVETPAQYARRNAQDRKSERKKKKQQPVSTSSSNTPETNTNTLATPETQPSGTATATTNKKGYDVGVGVPKNHPSMFSAERKKKKQQPVSTSSSSTNTPETNTLATPETQPSGTATATTNKKGYDVGVGVPKNHPSMFSDSSANPSSRILGLTIFLSDVVDMDQYKVSGTISKDAATKAAMRFPNMGNLTIAPVAGRAVLFPVVHNLDGSSITTQNHHYSAAARGTQRDAKPNKSSNSKGDKDDKAAAEGGKVDKKGSSGGAANASKAYNGLPMLQVDARTAYVEHLPMIPRSSDKYVMTVFIRQAPLNTPSIV